MTTGFCTECGAHVGEGQHFCGVCGHPIAAATPVEPTTSADVGTPPGATGGGEAPPPATPATPAEGGTTPPERRRGRRWVALVVVLALVAGGLATALVLSSGGESGAKEITLEPADSSGADPFTQSSETTAQPVSTQTTVAPPPTLGSTAQGTTVSGGATGLYGGTLNQGSCDVEQQITFLRQNAEKADAFAGVLGISVAEIPSYLRSLTPVILRYDTRVTNHGFVDGHATSLQAVLQAGTAVLVDRYGTPRVKCNCGNPLTPPVDLADQVRYHGDMWDGFSLRNTTIIIENKIEINVFVIVDFDLDVLVDRDAGSTGGSDTIHEGGTTGGGTTGGQTTSCGSSADEAVSRLIAARRARDKTAATQACATVNVIDYMWKLDNSVASGLTASACAVPENFSDPYHTGAEVRMCALSNGVTLVAEYYAPASPGWIVNFVITDGSTGGGTTSTGGGDEGGAVLCATSAQEAAGIVLDARVTNNRTKATGCAAGALLDELFANTLDWSGVTIKRCDSASPTETVANVVAAQMCYLSNGFRFEVWKSSLPIQWYVGKLWRPGV